MSRRVNLNAIEPVDDCGNPVSCGPKSAASGSVAVFFDDLEQHLVREIAKADFVVGCMAWLTNRRVLTALAGVKHGCQIVVQKEDFLRPGVVGRADLQRHYNALRSQDRFGLPSAAGNLSYCCDPTAGAVRCMGMRPQHAKDVVPRMHHKFFVFLRRIAEHHFAPDPPRPIWEPYAVWTGSFNATENATLSRENATLISDVAIADAYQDEWLRVFAVSEPLDWESDFVEPEWRFGS